MKYWFLNLIGIFENGLSYNPHIYIWVVSHPLSILNHQGPFVQSPQFASVFLGQNFLHRVRFSPFLLDHVNSADWGRQKPTVTTVLERCTSVSPKRSLEAKERRERKETQESWMTDQGDPFFWGGCVSNLMPMNVNFEGFLVIFIDPWWSLKRWWVHFPSSRDVFCWAFFGFKGRTQETYSANG